MQSTQYLQVLESRLTWVRCPSLPSSIRTLSHVCALRGQKRVSELELHNRWWVLAVQLRPSARAARPSAPSQLSSPCWPGSPSAEIAGGRCSLHRHGLQYNLPTVTHAQVQRQHGGELRRAFLSFHLCGPMLALMLLPLSRRQPGSHGCSTQWRHVGLQCIQVSPECVVKSHALCC